MYSCDESGGMQSVCKHLLVWSPIQSTFFMQLDLDLHHNFSTSNLLT